MLFSSLGEDEFLYFGIDEESGVLAEANDFVAELGYPVLASGVGGIPA